jgi:ribose transport system substrate-binding protein
MKDKTHAYYVIGFSQATTVEPWRIQFNLDLKEEATKHKNIKLLIMDANDNVDKQIADVEYLIDCRVDALLISPKEATGLTPVVERAIDRRIPVFVLDRNVNTDRYTKFVGGCNREIGRMTGRHAIKLLEKGGGSVLEIWGGLRTEVSHQRHQGFDEEIKKYNKTKQRGEINLITDQYSADWKKTIAYEVMTIAMRRHDKVDLVYCHNDAMANGAYLAAKDCGREKKIKFIGIDGLDRYGKRWVKEGSLAATFIYNTPGAEGLRQAIDYLESGRVTNNKKRTSF